MKLKTVTCKLLVALFLLGLFLSACTGSKSPQSEGDVPTLTGIATRIEQPPTTTLPSPTHLQSPTIPAGQIRSSTLAGTWYPADPDELGAMIDRMLSAVEPTDGAPVALIVPHAGYVFSGSVAARGYKQLEGQDYEIAVIIATDHQPPLSNPISVWVEGGFETPLGVVPVDAELAEALVAADALISDDPAAHEREHPIEIELPFLQRVCPKCRIVPVLMGDSREETILALSDALLSVLPGKRAIVIASSDLSRYPTYSDASIVDGATLAAIESGEPRQVRETLSELLSAGTSNLVTRACGEGPILVAMRVAQGLGAETTSVLTYANSGDSPYGDKDQVVGYGAVMLWHYDPPVLTEDKRPELLAIARATLETYQENGIISTYESTVDSEDSFLTRRSGVFVTLKEDGVLRGRKGYLQSHTSLYQAVQELTISAAMEDARFPPLTGEELDKVNIEISILTPLRRVTDIEQIEVGTHGLLLIQSGQRSFFLPQASLEQDWDREALLENLCVNAELSPDCWTGTPTLYSFTTIVFGED